MSTERSITPEPTLDVLISPFRLTADHGLLRSAETFGLSDRHGHKARSLPRHQPWCARGRLYQPADFDAEGFAAASVTAVSGVAGGVPPRLRYTTRLIDAVFDRPFGFGRSTGRRVSS